RRTRIKKVRNNFEARRQSKQWQEERGEDIEEEIEIRKGEIIKEYKEKLGKKNDPYEPIEKKVEKEKLKRMYDFLWPEDRGKPFSYQDLFIENGQVYYQEDGEKVKMDLPGISHIIKKYRYYPEGEVGSHFLGFVSSEDSSRGNYGLEGFFNQELAGQHGFIKSGTEEKENTIVINNKEYKKPRDGSDLILSIDRAIQFYVCRQLEEAVKKHGAESGSVVVVNPRSGGLIAMCSYPDFNPNKYNQVEDIQVYNNSVIFEDYEPGSVFKTITIGSALDREVISPGTTYKDEGKIKIDKWTIKNSDYASHGPHGVVDMNYVLTHSLNTGSIFAMEQTTPNVFGDYVKKFGFGSKTGIELEGESKGDIKNLRREDIPKIYAATASYGQGITATPLQMLMSYAAIANQGVLMKPYIVKKMLMSNGQAEVTEPVKIRRVISERAATLLSGMLVNVIEGGHAKKAGVEGYYVGGKTGTAQVASEEGGYGQKTIHTFVGFAPVEKARFAMLVKLNDPKDVKYSASSAAPLFGKLA
ncbi:MAG TPA: penicillin-binding protein 2, partial [Patescibacteria group bacterium]|nr:penicillin-binding protein 2 [Patescibacteria group bacterium]